MRRNSLILGLLSFVLVLGACGDDGEERARTVDPPHASESADQEPENAGANEPESGDLDVEAALLTLDDMPTGWTQGPDEAPSDEDAGADATLCEEEPLSEGGAHDEASADFSAGDFGPQLSHTVWTLDSDQSERGLEALIEALNNCEEWTEETADGPVTFRPAPLSFPSFGDEIVAIRIDVESELFDATMDMIAWRRANVMSLLGVIEVFGTPDGEQTEEFVRVADERIDSLQ